MHDGKSCVFSMCFAQFSRRRCHSTYSANEVLNPNLHFQVQWWIRRSVTQLNSIFTSAVMLGFRQNSFSCYSSIFLLQVCYVIVVLNCFHLLRNLCNKCKFFWWYCRGQVGLLTIMSCGMRIISHQMEFSRLLTTSATHMRGAHVPSLLVSRYFSAISTFRNLVKTTIQWQSSLVILESSVKCIWQLGQW